MRRYIITGIGRLTREREAITVPCSLEKCKSILAREKKKPSRKRDYLYLRMEICPPQQLILDFKEE